MRPTHIRIRDGKSVFIFATAGLCVYQESPDTPVRLFYSSQPDEASWSFRGISAAYIMAALDEQTGYIPTLICLAAEEEEEGGNA